MKSIRNFSILILIVCIIPSVSIAQKVKDHVPEQANWRVDNNGYWKMMAEKGLTTLNPMVVVPKAKYTGSEIEALSSATLDSPDVPVTTENSSQSENSIFVNPADYQNLLNSNNSCANPYPPFYGANDFYSFDGGLTWAGEIQGAGVANSGDPAVVIGNNGWYYVNHIISGSSYGQQVAYSTDEGASWNVVVIDDGASAYVLDKNHFWIDNNLNSPYESNLYCAWTDFGGAFNYDIAFSYSSDQGLSWSSSINISSAVNAGSHCQGVNINTGPNGEVYAVYAIYDAKADENAFGLTKSLDGGATWEPATRIIENVRGIRSSETSKNQRVNSFPVLAVDNSDGAYGGNLYMVWANIGTPGINTGTDIDVYMIRSSDQGDTWSDPIRVNQDAAGLGKEHYFPWITCDPTSGDLSVVFYDDRNVGSNECEVFCANSLDGGDTWEDFKVSDVSFTPTPIPGLADGYMGDYLGITARNSYVYPCWTDNRTGTSMTYVSPYVIYWVQALADPSAVCYGGSVQLDCEVFGGSGSYAYIWTSDPPGFNSTLQNPTVIPLENTTYFVEAGDGTNTGNSQVEVTVYELPSVTIGSDTTICEGEEITFDAGPGFTTYEWQDGSSGQSYTASESGIFWVEVTNEFGCTDQDSVILTIKQAPAQPAKPAGPGFVDIYEGNITTYVTTEFPDILYYLWELEPATAGNIMNNGFEATVEWDMSFTGQVQIQAMAANICGDSPWSDSLQITVINTTGIADLEQTLDMGIYPNPNNGTFTLELSTQEKMYINIYVFNSNNALVYTLENLHLVGHHYEQINLNNLAKGIYTLTIESKKGKLSRQVVLSE